MAKFRRDLSRPVGENLLDFPVVSQAQIRPFSDSRLTATFFKSPALLSPSPRSSAKFTRGPPDRSERTHPSARPEAIRQGERFPQLLLRPFDVLADGSDR